MKLTRQQITFYAQRTGLTGNSLDTAVAIALAESGGDTNAVNPGGPGDYEYSVGLWQINVYAHPEYDIAHMKDANQNALAMYAISNQGTNWNPWGSYKNGSYRKYFTDTSSAQTGFSITTPVVAATTNPVVATEEGSGFKYILAYTIAIAIFVLIAKTRIGYNAIYYSLLLALLFLLVTQAKFIANALAPITQPEQQTTTV